VISSHAGPSVKQKSRWRLAGRDHAMVFEFRYTAMDRALDPHYAPFLTKVKLRSQRNITVLVVFKQVSCFASMVLDPHDVTSIGS
jgi:hypothetical protein